LNTACTVCSASPIHFGYGRLAGLTIGRRRAPESRSRCGSTIPGRLRRLRQALGRFFRSLVFALGLARSCSAPSQSSVLAAAQCSWSRPPLRCKDSFGHDLRLPPGHRYGAQLMAEPLGRAAIEAGSVIYFGHGCSPLPKFSSAHRANRSLVSLDARAMTAAPVSAEQVAWRPPRLELSDSILP
jgi:hypothetical protein